MSKASVYLNGSLIGVHSQPHQLADDIRQKRHRGELPQTLTVRSDKDEVFINTETGRALRPLIIVENGEPKLTEEHVEKIKEGEMTFKDLLKNGVVEYVDADEEENIRVAMEEEELTKDHTHLEIHPSLCFGVCSSVNPYPEHSMSQRVAKGDSMMKQSMGVHASNYRIRTDREAYISFYPQKPITTTRYEESLGLDKRPAGQNFTIAVTPYLGYNINDAIILNRASVERALSRGAYLRTYSSKERRYPGGQKDRFEVPPEKVTGYRGEEAYKYLDEDGIINPETEVEAGGVIIGKTSPPRFLEEAGELTAMEEKRKEDSETIRPTSEGKIDWVMATQDEDGNRLIKVRTKKTMAPMIGDKFGAKSGQKGVVGLIVDEGDMPWSESGVVPDMIFNSHAIPSRMTIGFLLEALGSKSGAMEGKRNDGTAFDNKPQKAIEEELENHGFNPSGKEVMYDGRTGERIESRIFNGIVHYNRLEHLVAKKMQSRSTGPVQILTRQPTEGKARRGGLKIGIMERDCLIGHGSSSLLNERLLKQSDRSIQYICTKCGSVGFYDRIRGEERCSECGSNDLERVETSYAFKVLLNELKAMLIKPKLNLEDKA